MSSSLDIVGEGEKLGAEGRGGARPLEATIHLESWLCCLVQPSGVTRSGPHPWCPGPWVLCVCGLTQ